ncbi:lipopolysaccharide biosynthesis protein [[Limnothrix rosea] IAM M-220]|uniref:lipopolysaccharide biosynthesis protein n=1 Tax=[Limnothrix rosea] IAM M-220 TaxID=454133 RepID=UPI000A05507C|nr:oligosaccharide flippase family protein [[Limnothrix rosea] IAM M-220]
MIKGLFADGIFRRILKNFSWLLIGQIFTAIANFGYLSLTAHRLGLELFGLFILARAFIEILIGVTTFQSWQAFIRYGAVYLKEKNRDALQHLIKVTTLLDILGSCGGFFVAITLAPFVGSLVGWDASTIREVQWCSVLMLFTLGSTPMGLLRLFDRFNWLALQQTVPAFTRLAGTIIALSLEAPFWSYLFIWVFAEAMNGVSLLFLGWREVRRQGLLEGMDWSCPNLFTVDRTLLKFCLVSNLNSSLPLVMTVSPLIIGIFATPVAVGLYRAGYELATPLREVALLFTHSVYPELAHLSSRDRWRKFSRIVLKFSFILKGFGLLLFLLGLWFGKDLLYYAMGEDFVAAYATLMVMVVAGIFNMGNCLLEPALFAMGLPQISLRVNSIAILGIYLPMLVILTIQFGAIGAGLATLISFFSSFTLNTVLTWQQIRLKIKLKQRVRELSRVK